MRAMGTSRSMRDVRAAAAPASGSRFCGSMHVCVHDDALTLKTEPFMQQRGGSLVMLRERGGANRSEGTIFWATRMVSCGSF